MSYEQLRTEEVRSVIETADEMGARDSLLVRLLFHTGARIGELCPLVAGDVEPALGDLHLGRDLIELRHLEGHHSLRKRKDGSPRRHYKATRSITLLGFDDKGLNGKALEGVPSQIMKRIGEGGTWTKGGYAVKRGLKANEPVRTVPLTNLPTRSILRDTVEGAKRSTWILPSNKGGFLTYIGAYKRVVKAMIAGGIPKSDPRCHPHTTRHSFAVDKLKRGMPLPILQRILGHADIGTTAIYLKFVVDDLREASEAVGSY